MSSEGYICVNMSNASACEAKSSKAPAGMPYNQKLALISSGEDVAAEILATCVSIIDDHVTEESDIEAARIGWMYQATDALKSFERQRMFACLPIPTDQHPIEKLIHDTCEAWAKQEDAEDSDAMEADEEDGDVDSAPAVVSPLFLTRQNAIKPGRATTPVPRSED